MASNESDTVQHEDVREPLGAKVKQAALIGLLSLVINLVGNGQISLWDRDEPRYAGCTREMRESGDFVHPTFNAEPRYHKPILIYWLMLCGTAIGGDNEFGARLVSALAGAGTCLLIWGLGRRMMGRKVGLLAALMLATAPISVYNAKAATTDATLTFFFVGCMFALWELNQRASKRAVWAFWICLSLATLTKGPVGPVFIGLAGLVSWLWSGSTACWTRLRWRWGIPGFLLLTAPWYIAIGILSHGEFYRVAMGFHVIRRMTTGIETHGGFPGYYITLSLVCFFPWSTLMPPALVGAWHRRKALPAMGFLAGWVLGPLIFLELVRTKLIHYYLPAYPAGALLCGWLVAAVLESEINLRRWPLGRLGLALLAATSISLTVGLFAAVFIAPAPLRVPCFVTGLILGAGNLLALGSFYRGQTQRAACCLVGMSAGWLLLLGAWLLPAADPFRLSPLVGRALANLAEREQALPLLGGFKPPGVVYYFGEPVGLMESRESLLEQVRQHGAVAVALTPKEVEELQRDRDFALEARESIRGFNVERARFETVQLTLIRPPSSGLARRPEQASIE